MIRQKEYCDICELKHGEESPRAEIPKDLTRPAFPQLTWTYFKKGLQILKDPKGLVYLKKNWLGSVMRLELCSVHASQFNTFLKGFSKDDYALGALLDKMQVEDNHAWDQKQKDIETEFKMLQKKSNKEKK